jgi:hypothetical protein
VFPKLHREYATMSSHNQEVAVVALYHDTVQGLYGPHTEADGPFPRRVEVGRTEFFEAFFARHPQATAHRLALGELTVSRNTFSVRPERWAAFCAGTV